MLGVEACSKPEFPKEVACACATLKSEGRIEIRGEEEVGINELCNFARVN